MTPAAQASKAVSLAGDENRIGPITIFSAALEAGRDGVSDYSFNLAEGLAQAGEKVTLVALHDRYVEKTIEFSRNGVRGLRLPRTMTWPEKTGRVRAAMEASGARMISFQFVPYSYDPKGIVLGLGPRLRDCAGNLPWQVMCHELWLGTTIGVSWKQRLWGWLQRRSITRMLDDLRPTALHTSISGYASMLQDTGRKAEVLGLFGNIPVVGVESWNWLVEKSAGRLAGERGEWWLFGFFGTLHPAWPPEPLLSLLAEAARKSGRRPALVSFGRLGAGEEFWSVLERKYAEHFAFVKLGEQAPKNVSHILMTVDFGIAASPLALLGKSGTALAMIEHGLPVLVNRDDVRFRNGAKSDFAGHPLVHAIDTRLPEWLPNVRRGTAGSLLPEKVAQMVESIRRGKRLAAGGAA